MMATTTTTTATQPNMKMTPSQAFHNHPIIMIAHIIIIIAALNMLGQGFGKNIFERIAGDHVKIIYVIVGVAGVMLAYHKIMWITNSTKKH